MIHKLTQAALQLLVKANGDIAGYINNFKSETKVIPHADKIVLIGQDHMGFVSEFSVLLNGQVKNRQFVLETEIPPLRDIDHAITDLNVAIHLARLDMEDKVSLDVASNFIEAAKRLMSEEGKAS